MPLADKTASRSSVSLPGRSQEVEAIVVVGETANQEAVTRQVSLVRLAQQVVQASRNRGCAYRVLIIDDEPLYLSAIESYLRVSPELASAVSVEKCDASEMVLSTHCHKPLDLIISDIDLGTHLINGFDLVRDIRKLGCPALICVHSNRVVASDSKEAFEAGADVFVPKPMGAEQLLRLLLKSGDLAAIRLRESVM